MILFSVIIPHFNSVVYLKKLIKTVPEDDRIQLIVVDDKSTESISDVEKILTARKGIFIHNLTDRKGAGTCRNLGILEAEGKWIIFADADDYFLPNAFDILYRYVDTEDDIVYFTPTSVYRDTGQMANRHWHNYSLVYNYWRNPTKKNEQQLRYKYKSPCSKMIKKVLIEENNITFDEVPAANDVMFSMKCGYYAKSIGASDQTIYCVTSASGTLETAYNKRNFWSGVEVHKARCQFLQEKLSKKEYRRLGLGGLPFILSAIKKGYDYEFIREIYVYLKENHLRICTFRELMDVVNRYWLVISRNK